MNLRPFVGPPTSKRSQRGIAATESAMKLLPALKVGDNPFLFAGEYWGLIHPDRLSTPKLDADRPAGVAGTRLLGSGTSSPGSS
jgi:hypothetical protein